MLIDLRIEPECKEEAYCEECRARIHYPRTICPECDCEIIWVDLRGRKVATYPTRTPGMEYAFRKFRMKFFESEYDRERFEALEKELGSEVVIYWTDWLTHRGSAGKVAKNGLYSCLTKHGRPHEQRDKLGGSREVLDGTVSSREEFLAELAREGELHDL